MKGDTSNRPASLTRRNSVGQASGGSSSADNILCGTCSKAVGSDCIECEICKKWHDLKCVKLHSADVKTIKKAGVHWFCEKCDRFGGNDGNSGIFAHEKRIENLEKNIEGIKQTIDESLSKHTELVKASYAEVLKNFDKKSEVIQGTIERQSEEIVKKQESISKEREKQLQRNKNFIIFGIQENDQISDTIQAVKDLLTSRCHIDVSHLMLNSGNVHRIGAKQIDRNRPVRISLDSEAAKWEILKRLNAQKIPGIFGRLDLTKEEQEKDFQLRQELKKKREEHPGTTFKIVKHQVVQISRENSY